MTKDSNVLESHCTVDSKDRHILYYSILSSHPTTPTSYTVISVKPKKVHLQHMNRYETTIIIEFVGYCYYYLSPSPRITQTIQRYQCFQFMPQCTAVSSGN